MIAKKTSKKQTNIKKLTTHNGNAAENKKGNANISKPENKKIKTGKGRKPVAGIIEKADKKKKSVMYFTEETEDAIVEYNNEKDLEKRNTIYETKIRTSLEKLVEFVFNTFKFTYFECSPLEMQQETVAHLVSNLDKYKKEKGKAYSFLTIVAKHYLIFHNNSNYKRFNQNVDISDTPSETTVCLQTEDTHHKNVELNEFIKLMISYWEENTYKVFHKPRDLNIANAVIELFRQSDKIDIFNKKALYLYIRDISGCKTQHITKIINKMKTHQRNITNSYNSRGILKA